mmetsp:Transcript_3439/g.6303  ORF Transcript_3439/g.6303 Transcript_3439/m.6303 type:complete len:367 (-) Transcript_3439:117-1217(-)
MGGCRRSTALILRNKDLDLRRATTSAVAQRFLLGLSPILFLLISQLRTTVWFMNTSSLSKTWTDYPLHYLEEDSPAIIRVFSPSKRNETVAICTIVKNETLYLDEWVDFHVALGFSKIFIYDNSPEPDEEMKSWLNSRRKDLREYVKIIHFPEKSKGTQANCYDRCIKFDAKNFSFVGLFDVDEFLVLKKHDNVIDFLGDHCNKECGEIYIHWQVMGLSNQTSYKPLPVTSRNVHTGGAGILIKPIIRPDYASDELNWLHGVSLKKGLVIDTRGRKIKKKRRKRGNDDKPSDVALFYHYRFKSMEELLQKTCIRGDVIGKNQCKKKGYLTDARGDTFDDSAWRQLKRMVPKYIQFENDLNKKSMHL